MKYECDNCGFAAYVPLYAYGDGRTLCEDCFDLATKPSEGNTPGAFSGRHTAPRASSEWKPGDVVGSDGKHVLCERENGGFRVQAQYLPLVGLPGITLSRIEDGESVYTTVPADRLLDAFEHPALYLSAAAVEKVGLR